MAKKGNRVQVIMECTEHKTSGMAGTSRYITTKNKKNTPERLELKKFVQYAARKLAHILLKSLSFTKTRLKSTWVNNMSLVNL